MAKTVLGRGGRPLDVEATMAARTRHAQGARLLAAIFGVPDGRDGGQAVEANEAYRRVQGGRGARVDRPTKRVRVGAMSPTRRHWDRPGLRKAGKAQRQARQKQQKVARQRR